MVFFSRVNAASHIPMRCLAVCNADVTTKDSLNGQIRVPLAKHFVLRLLYIDSSVLLGLLYNIAMHTSS